MTPESQSRIDRLEEIMCQAANVTPEELRQQTRNASVVAVRQALWYIAHDYLGHSYMRLGKRYKRDHTTVISGADRFKKSGLAPKVIAEVLKVAPDLLKYLEKGPARAIGDWDFGNVKEV